MQDSRCRLSQLSSQGTDSIRSCMADHAASNPLQVLYADHHHWLRGWLRRKLGCADRAADVTHETFLRILSSRDALLGMQEPRAYLTITARRLLIDQSRRKLLEAAYLHEMALLAETLPSHPSPEEILMAVQALDQIGEALNSVAAPVRVAFLRHYLDDQSQAVIAAELGVSKRTVQNHLVQALLCCRAHCSALGERLD